MNYRPEIDGLRAIAVLSVIFFHAGFSGFSGGYVGVDVFFVISGYLITSILLKDIRTAQFSLIKFYDRRVRRIIPALFLVMGVTIPFAWMWMSPEQLRDHSQNLTATTLFLSNILFYLKMGYFAQAGELVPLLHTWSLAIEEQYYLFFPILMALLLRGRSLKALTVGILIAFLASLYIAVFGLDLNFSSDGKNQFLERLNFLPNSFFLTFGRVWELMVGALIALWIPSPRSNTFSSIGSFCGLLAVIGSVFLFDESTPMPGLFTLIPVLGTAALIACTSSTSLVGRCLSARPFVSIGLISYSAYLWHQPVFAFARLRSLNEPSLWMMVGLCVLALVLGWASWRYVETPFRKKGLVKTRTVFVASAVTGAVLFVVGLTGYIAKGFPARFSDVQEQIAPPQTNMETACKDNWHYPYGKETRFSYCEFGDKSANKTVALIGDSHAEALFSTLDQELKDRKLRGVRLAAGQCHPIPGFVDDQRPTLGPFCQEVYKVLFLFLKEKTDMAIVSVRWSFQLYPIENSIETLLFDNGEGGVEVGPRYRENLTFDQNGLNNDATIKRNMLNEFLARLVDSGHPIGVVLPVPEIGWHVPNYNFKKFVLSGLKVPEFVSISYEVFKKRNRFVNDVFENTPSRSKLIYIRPEKVLCDTYVSNRCVAQIGQRPLYYDDDHLSDYGAKLVLAPSLSELFSEIGAVDGN
ncbi:MAG: acyltransferase [Rhodospirillaceae bacterium]|jgi:peptidoglycan/LPS O-acetylase OafA/YrhL|uniref:acyltransferase family protein n=1 Tax=unclassified Hwanghaeella TaxID=2605944 RepID=UPI000C49B1DB|nr:acyltransferase [Rhodospirillales bacterium]MAX47924.1 acyltransferase [Rhodospirillaceae bacterium]|tara:strand:- start:162214 stop:164295 length:2082 start_codon:yes stop_codon:yes gene_type:complete